MSYTITTTNTLDSTNFIIYTDHTTDAEQTLGYTGTTFSEYPSILGEIDTIEKENEDKIKSYANKIAETLKERKSLFNACVAAYDYLFPIHEEEQDYNLLFYNIVEVVENLVQHDFHDVEDHTLTTKEYADFVSCFTGTFINTSYPVNMALEDEMRLKEVSKAYVKWFFNTYDLAILDRL